MVSTELSLSDIIETPFEPTSDTKILFTTGSYTTLVGLAPTVTLAITVLDTSDMIETVFPPELATKISPSLES